MQIFGTVQDARTEKPLPGATVTLSIGDVDLIEDTPTDREGKFFHEFEGTSIQWEDQLLTCTVKKTGYHSRTITHKMVDEDAELELELVPVPVKWPRLLRLILYTLAALLILIALGIGVYYLFFYEPPVPPPPPKPNVLFFNSDYKYIAPGQEVTLTWDTENAKTVFLDKDEVETKGSKIVAPELTTVYTLIAKGKKEDEEKRAEKKIVVPPPPVIADFKANPAVIHQWESALLQWETVNGEFLYITDSKERTADTDKRSKAIRDKIGEISAHGDDEGEPLAESKELNGEVEVFPSRTTFYTLVVVNKAGVKVKKKVRVGVLVPPEIISFTATDKVIAKGDTTILNWNTEEATKVTLNGEQVAPDFSMEVAPKKVTTYELKVENPMASRIKKLTIKLLGEGEAPPPENVPPPKINRFLTMPPEIGIGQTCMIHWVTENAKFVYLDGERVEPVGSREVFPKETSNFQLKAVNGEEVATWTRTVDVRPVPCTVILYEFENFKGRAYEFTTDGPEIGDLNDIVSSIKIIGNCSVMAYSAPGFKGNHQVFRKSIPSLRNTLVGNNSISSFKLIHRLIGGKK